MSVVRISCLQRLRVVEAAERKVRIGRSIHLLASSHPNVSVHIELVTKHFIALSSANTCDDNFTFVSIADNAMKCICRFFNSDLERNMFSRIFSFWIGIRSIYVWRAVDLLLFVVVTHTIASTHSERFVTAPDFIIHTVWCFFSVFRSLHTNFMDECIFRFFPRWLHSNVHFEQILFYLWLDVNKNSKTKIGRTQSGNSHNFNGFCFFLSLVCKSILNFNFVESCGGSVSGVRLAAE